MSKSIKISGKILARYNEIISDDALQLIQEIHEKFNNKRLELLNERKNRQKDIDAGGDLPWPVQGNVELPPHNPACTVAADQIVGVHDPLPARCGVY